MTSDRVPDVVTVQVEPKPPGRSKTMVFNGATVLLIIASVLVLPEVAALIPAAAWPYVTAFVAAVNVVLRPGSTRPISLPWGHTEEEA